MIAIAHQETNAEEEDLEEDSQILANGAIAGQSETHSRIPGKISKLK
jgi:hypothetical protein